MLASAFFPMPAEGRRIYGKSLPRIPSWVIISLLICRGVLAQLGERKVRNLEARGSIPLHSTKTKIDKCPPPLKIKEVGIFQLEIPSLCTFQLEDNLYQVLTYPLL